MNCDCSNDIIVMNVEFIWNINILW